MSAGALHRFAAASFVLLATAATGTTGVGAPASAQTVYVAFGDSITEGVGDAVPEGPNAGYPIRLQNLLADGSVVRNRGLSGERTPEGLARLPGVLAEGGDVLLLMEGSNDITRRISLETTVFNLDEMARRAETAGMDAVHATLIPRLPDAKVDHDNMANQQLNQSLRDLAGNQHRLLVDNFQVYSSLSGLFGKYYWDSPLDPVGHPNPAGYDVMARTFANVLTGVDAVPPVPGLLRPNHGDARVDENIELRIEMWDFGRGIDLFSSKLFVDGVDTGAIATGSSRHGVLTFVPPVPWEGLVRVRLQTRDIGSPANVFDREIILFTANGTDFLNGDFDYSGSVDGGDLSRLIAAFGTVHGDLAWDPASDINGDDIVDGIDLALLAQNFGRTI
jgi:lysophospholipase L1-like esterase